MSKNVTQNNVGFSGLLLLIFITLKLCGIITWSWWWWVLSPLWISFALVVVIVFIALIVSIIQAARSK